MTHDQLNDKNCQLIEDTINNLITFNMLKIYIVNVR